MKSGTRKTSVMPYIFRLLFSAIGITFVVLFTIKGVHQAILILFNHGNDLVSLFSAGMMEREGIIMGIKSTLETSSISVLDIILQIMCIVLALHGLIGIYYIFFASYSISDMRRNSMFYLQIFSAIGAGFLVYLILSPFSFPHTFIGFIITVIIGVVTAVHLGNGFVKACFSLGISVSDTTKSVVRAISWIVGVLAFVQIFFMLV